MIHLEIGGWWVRHALLLPLLLSVLFLLISVLLLMRLCKYTCVCTHVDFNWEHWGSYLVASTCVSLYLCFGVKMCARRVNFSISVYRYVHDCVCLSVHASFMHPTICVPASANHNGHFMILAPSFHRAVSQSQPADESQVPAGLTLNRREKKSSHAFNMFTVFSSSFAAAPILLLVPFIHTLHLW